MERTQILYQKLQRGIIQLKIVGRVMALVLSTSSDDALHLYQVLRKYLERFQSYGADTISVPKNTKGHNSVKNVGRVMGFVLCTSSDVALQLYQVS